jgi:hypothetical protein
MEAYILAQQKLEETRPDDQSPAEWEKTLQLQAEHKPRWWKDVKEIEGKAEWYRRRAEAGQRTVSQEMHDLVYSPYYSMNAMGADLSWRGKECPWRFVFDEAEDEARQQAISIMEAYILAQQKLEEMRPDGVSPAEWEKKLKYQAKHKPRWWNRDGKRAAMAEWYRRRNLARERTGRQEMYDLSLQCYGMGPAWEAANQG